jgi:pectin methylesterase-like acyl-CoA thioesterase
VEKQQAVAVALRVKDDKSIFFNCWIEGNHNTLFRAGLPPVLPQLRHLRHRHPHRDATAIFQYYIILV